MRKHTLKILMAGFLLGALPLKAQQPCPGLPVVMNTPEDKLMLAVNGADDPQQKVEALNAFAAEHPDSTFIPCVNEYLTMAYVKLQDFPKAIEAGEKDLAADYLDLNLLINLLKAYVGSGNASDKAFDLIGKAPEIIHSEIGSSIPATATEEEAQKLRQADQAQTKDFTAYMEYAFFQLLPRVTDSAKRLAALAAFVKGYPETTNVGQINTQYLLAYQMANQPDKMFEYGEKAVASDASNVSTLNLVADAYASARAHLKEAGTYAKKALELGTNLQKPEGMTDEQFKIFRDTQLGLAHYTLGYVALLEGSERRNVAPAIGEFEKADDLLASNPALQGRTLYWLGWAYERIYPPRHSSAIQALTKATELQSPYQGEAQKLLNQVKQAQ